MYNIEYLICLLVMSGLLVFQAPLWLLTAVVIFLLICRLMKKLAIGELYILLSAVVYSIYFIYLDFDGVLLYSVSDLTVDVVRGQIRWLQILCVGIAFLYSLFLRRNSVELFEFYKKIKNPPNLWLWINFFINLFLLIGQIYVVNKFGFNSRIEINEYYKYLPYLKFCYLGLSAFYLTIAFESEADFKFKIISIVVCVFWALEVLLGARREFIFLMLYVFSYLYFYNKIRLMHILLASFLFISVALVGYVRNFENVNSSWLVDSLGEFLFPMQTLLYAIDFGLDGTMLSIANVFLYLLPKSFSGILMSSAQNFSEMMGDPRADFNIGYAFTPLTDLALSFGANYFILYPVVTAVFLYILEKRIPILNIILAASILNFYRSEYATFAIEFFIVSAGFLGAFFSFRCVRITDDIFE